VKTGGLNQIDRLLDGAEGGRGVDAMPLGLLPCVEPPFFSKVTVTASMEVVPKSTDTAITPGSRAGMLSRPDPACAVPCAAGRPERMKNMAVQARGKTIPQLMFGGLR
jgi:hypothetical protein